MTASCTVVVPCFNWAQRLDPGRLEALIGSPDIRILAVDGGSTDTTAALLDTLAGADPDRISVLALGTNRGEATGRFVESPLRQWSDPGGSKMTAKAGLRAGVDLGRIGRALRRAD